MKRFLSLLLGTVCILFANANDNVTITVTGKQLTIGLENTLAYCAFQMDFELPEGMSATAVEKAERLVTAEGVKEFFDVDSDIIGDNTLRIIVYNDDNQAIPGNEGDLLNLTLSAALTEQIAVKNIRFVKASNLHDVVLADAATEIPVIPEYTIGDVNADGNINIQDYMGIAKYILQGDFDGFVFDAGDTNSDGTINVQDYMAVAKIILGGGANSAHRVAAMADESINDRIVGTIDGDGTIRIGLENTLQYSMFQMDVTLPEGASLTDVMGTDRMKKNHTVDWQKQDGNVWRILVGTTSLATFRGNEGNLLTLSVEGLTEGCARVDNSLFVTPENVLRAMDTLTLGTVTGITSVDAGHTDNTIYNLQGQKVDPNSKLVPGVYVANGKKIIVK